MTTLEFPQTNGWGHVVSCDHCKTPLNIVVEFGHGEVICAACADQKFGWTIAKPSAPEGESDIQAHFHAACGADDRSPAHRARCGNLGGKA